MFLGHADEDGSGWSSRDRELAKALMLEERLHCPDCGQLTEESHDPDREGWYITEPIICAGCQALAKASRDASDEPGLRFAVRPDPGYVKRS